MKKPDMDEKRAIRIVLQELKTRIPSSQYVGYVRTAWARPLRAEVKKAMKLVENFLK